MYKLLSSALFALLLLDPVFAAPTRHGHHTPYTFKVDRVAAGRKERHGPKALRKAYSKWGMIGYEKSTLPFTSTLFSAPGINASVTGKVTATPEHLDAEFLSPVIIGGQTLMMNFDTGSSDLWVFNTALPDQQSAGHTEFDPTKSSTFNRLDGQSFFISYGDSSNASGTVGTDTVNIGGATVTSQAVELATAVSESFASDVQSNGIVGLAFSRLNAVKPTKQKTFFDNISSSLAEPVLTANLKHATPGAYEFGRIDSTQYTGALEWIPINAASGFWQFPSNTFSVGGGPIQQNSDGNPAIADTGTSLLLVDQSVVDGYYSEVKGSTISQTAGGVVFPCGAVLPDLKIAMGASYMATISGSLLNYAEIGMGTNKDGSRTDYCFGAIQSSGGAGVQIFGDVMFKSQFVAFNNGNNSIGAAPHSA